MVRTIIIYSIGCSRCRKVERLLKEYCQNRNVQLVKKGFWKSLGYGLIKFKRMPVVLIDGKELCLEKVMAMDFELNSL